MGLSGKKAKAQTTTPVFSNSNQFDYNVGGLGTASSVFDTKTGKVNTTSSLGPSYESALGNIGQGLQANTAYYQQDPTQRMAALEGGQNLFYNALQQASDRQYAQRSGETFADLSRRGLLSSSMTGGHIAQGLYDRGFQENQNKLAALQYLDQSHLNELQGQVQALSGIGNVALAPAQIANNNLMTAKGLVDSRNAQNDALVTQANIANASRPSVFGQLLSAGGQIAAAAIGACDPRLKRNVKAIGVHESGLPLYSYDYIWGVSSIGVMADEAMERFPQAVTRGADGFLSVDYARLAA